MATNRPFLPTFPSLGGSTVVKQRRGLRPSWIREFAGCRSEFRNVDNPDCPRRRVDTDGVNRPTPCSHKRRLKTLLAIRCQNSPSNGRSGLGMAVVFLEGGLSPIPMQMASTKFNLGPHCGVCQFRCRTQGLTNSTKRNSLLNFAFLASRGTTRL